MKNSRKQDRQRHELLLILGIPLPIKKLKIFLKKLLPTNNKKITFSFACIDKPSLDNNSKKLKMYFSYCTIIKKSWRTLATFSPIIHKNSSAGRVMKNPNFPTHFGVLQMYSKMQTILLITQNSVSDRLFHYY